MKYFQICILAVLILSACRSSASPTLPPTRADLVSLGQPFSLGVMQEASISSSNLKIRFDDILEDSRCPTKVNCVWAGRARIEISLWTDGGPIEQIELNTFHHPPTAYRIQDYLNYQVELISLEPLLEYPDKPIASDKYRLTLVVNQK